MKILILTNSGIGLYKFRKELIQESSDQGHQVILSFPKDDFVPKLQELCCEYIESNVDRRGTNPITDIKLLHAYIQVIKRLRPDIVLTYTIKQNIYGGLACQITKTPYISNITGLGTAVYKGVGTLVAGRAVINSSSRIGKGCMVNTSRSVDHDNILRDYLHVSPGAHLAGSVKVGKGCWIGIGSVISNNVNICSGCKVGAGAVVVKDITEPGTYVGVPVRKID